MCTWKTILEFPNYQVSNDGRVRNMSGRLMYTEVDRYGYARVRLRKNGMKKNRKIHVLVADAFLDRAAGSEVNHIDRNKLNNRVDNRVDNLECLTHAENMRAWMQQDGKIRNIIGDIIDIPEYKEDPF